MAGKRISEEAPTPCQKGQGEQDLTWLLHRTAQVVGACVQQAVTAHGLDGMRDYIVLVVLRDGAIRTQVELGQALGLDKTTLTTVLDRLEKAGLVVRRIDPANRRARFPEITEAGRTVEATLQRERQQVEAALLAGLPEAVREQLPHILAHLIKVGEARGVPVTGSCV